MFGLAQEQWRDLLLSVNTHRKARRLSPYDAALLIDKALQISSIEALAEALRFSDTSTLRRIHRLRELRPALGALVGWGSRRGMASMSTATELLRLSSMPDVEDAFKRAVENDLTKDEVRQIVQMRERSKLTIEECVQEALKTRPRVERYELIIGGLGSPEAIRFVEAKGDEEASRFLKRKLASSFPTIVCQSTRVSGSRFTVFLREEEGVALRAQLGSQSIEDKVTELLAAPPPQ